MSQLLLDLTRKFDRLEQILKFKNDSIILNYERDVNTIQTIEVSKITNWINDHRQSKLEQLNEKRNLQIANINSLRDGSLSDPNFLSKIFEAFGKANQIYFNKSHDSFVRFFFKQFRSKSGYDFIQIAKYYHFIFKLININLKLPKSYSINVLNCRTGSCFLILPNAQIGLLVDLGKRADRFLIVDSLGTIKYTKKLSQKCISQEFKASAQHIIYLFKNNLKQDRSFIEIYDFKLKLLNSFNFNEYFSNIITYDHFFFISSIHKKKILVYDIERQQITRLNFNCDIKLGLAEPLLFHFDGSYYYITNNVDCVYLIDCKTFEIHKTIATTGGMLFSIFSADYHGNIIQYDVY